MSSIIFGDDTSSLLEHAQAAAIDEARYLIDQEIAKFSEAIRQLRSRRNELATISRLPPEILGKIFGFAVGNSNPYRNPATWFSFSYVSHLWREVALSTPNIWGLLEIKYPQWAEAMLERSKMTDLRIRSASLTADNLALLNTVFDQNISRIREILLVGLSNRALNALFKHPRLAPRLLTLRIDADTHSFNSPKEQKVESLFAEADQLRYLDLSGCQWDWGSQLFGTLTSLKIHQATSRPNLTDFLVALQRMPTLQILDLESSLPLISDSEHSTTGIAVTLPNLQTLRLSSTMSEISQVIGSFVIPSAKTHALECRSMSRGRNSGNLVSWLSATLRSTGIRYRTLIMSFDGNECNMRAWKEEMDMHLQFVPGLSDPHLSLKLLGGTSEKALLDIIQALPLIHLRTLRLTCLDMTEKTLLKAFGNLPRVQQVGVAGDGVPTFIKALMHKTKQYNTQKSAVYNVSFPALKQIWIELAKFDGDRPGSLSIKTMQDCLIERYERGAEVEMLAIEDCYYFDESDCALMEEIVVDVEWDEQIQESDEVIDSDGNYYI